MATNVTIIYAGRVGDEIRMGESIPRYFAPTNSYVDTPVFTEGFANVNNLGDGESYGKSIYATNVDGMGELNGLLPMKSFTGKLAQFERAILAAKEAKDKGAQNTGITFQITGYEDELYWNQIAGVMYPQGLYIKVGDKEYGKQGN